MIGFVTWPPLFKANRKKYAINYCMSFKELKVFLIKLASADIKAFGHTCLFALLLLIGLELFTPQVFLLFYTDVT